VVEQHKKDRNVLGILLFGSAARNKLDRYSDIDIYVLLRKKGKLSRSNFIVGARRVDVIFDAIQETKKYLNTENGNLRRITSHMLAHGKILFQRGDYLKRFLFIAQRNLRSKTKLENSAVLMHKYSIDDFFGEVQRDTRNNDSVAFGLDSQLLMGNIIELFLRSKGEYLRQPNEMRETLRKLDKKFSREIESFYETGDIKRKGRILAGLVRRVYKISGGALPKRWSLAD